MLYTSILYGGQFSSKQFASNAGDTVSVPRSGRSPGEGNGHPLQYSCLRNPMDRGVWQDTIHGVAESNTTKQQQKYQLYFNKTTGKKCLYYIYTLLLPNLSYSNKVISVSFYWDSYHFLWFHGILQTRILERVAFPFSRRSSQPKDQTQVSHIVGRFFTSWATMEAQEYWSG